MAQKRSFETSLARLTEIVEALESDTTSLADAMKLYEEGIELSQACRRELERAEQKITQLRQQADSVAEEANL